MRATKCINFGVNDVACRIKNLFEVTYAMAELEAKNLCQKVEAEVKKKTIGKITWDSEESVAYADETTSYDYIMDIITIELARQVKVIAFGREEEE